VRDVTNDMVRQLKQLGPLKLTPIPQADGNGAAAGEPLAVGDQGAQR
jgi:hypothetical protein